MFGQAYEKEDEALAPKEEAKKEKAAPAEAGDAPAETKKAKKAKK